MKKWMASWLVLSLLATGVVFGLGGCTKKIAYTLDKEDTYDSLTFDISSQWTKEESAETVQHSYYADGKLVLVLDFELADNVLDTTDQQLEKVADLFESDTRYTVISKAAATVDGLDGMELVISDSQDTGSKQDTVFAVSDGYFVYNFRIKNTDMIEEETIDAMRKSIDVEPAIEILSVWSMVFEDGSIYKIAAVSRFSEI